MKPWSLSKIQCYESCPMKYKYQYIDKIKPDANCNGALIKGSKIHNILENIDNFIDEQSRGEEYDIVNNFIKSPLFKSISEKVQLGEKEVAFGIDIIDGKLVPTEYNNKVLFRGKIDLLYKNRIFDYKTGKFKSYDDQDWTQLKWYAIWFFLKYPEYDEVHISYLYVEHCRHNTMTIRRDKINDITNDMLSRIKNVTVSESEPITRCNRNALCAWCGYMLLCEGQTQNSQDDMCKVNFELL